METLVMIAFIIGWLALVDIVFNLAGWLACRHEDDRYVWSLWIFAGPWIYYDKVVRNDSD